MHVWQAPGSVSLRRVTVWTAARFDRLDELHEREGVLVGEEKETELVEFELTIGAEEYEQILGVAFMTGPDERAPEGLLTLYSDGTTRRWGGIGDVALTVIDAGSDSRTYSYGISPRVIYGWLGASGGSGEAELRIATVDGETFCEVRGEGGYFRTAMTDVEPVDIAAVIARHTGSDDEEASVTVDADQLGELMAAAQPIPYKIDEFDTRPPAMLDVVDAGLRLRVDWPDVGPATYLVSAPSVGTATVMVMLNQFRELLRIHDGDLRIVVPKAAYRALRIEEPGRTSLLMPINLQGDVVGHVEECIESVFGPEALQADEDGDYQLSLFGAPVYARIIDDDPALLRVFAIVLRDAPETPELLTELNDLNLGRSFARVVVKDGTVLAIGDLVAATVDDMELEALFMNIAETASDIGPAISAMFGGTTVGRGEWYRWGSYVDTAILAEVRPHRWVELVGPSATDEWDLPDEVFVLTAYNPFGRLRPKGQNVAALAELAGVLISSGGTAVRALGKSLDGEHSEPSLLTWGMDERTVLEIAQQYRQEAVFRLTKDSVEVVGAFADHRVTRPRRMERTEE
ncbi:MAG: DUF3293 domain-containing protein [Microthrixaceae bacterium]|nr:DUF3293 domain-containing protein [Microthrixaceae bacterium]